MRNLIFSILIFTATTVFCPKNLLAQPKDLSQYYAIVSVPYPMPDNDQKNFPDVNFRFGWNRKTPYAVAVQFVNHGYKSRKFKFTIKDITSKKTIVLNKAHNSSFGSETLKETSSSNIWSGLVDNIDDSFSLRIWDSDGDEFDTAPLSIKDQK